MQSTTISNLQLDVVSGPSLELPPMPPDGEVVFGRGQDCHVPMIDQTVSRRHASLVRRKGRWMLSDLSSRHGTSLNGSRLQPGEAVAVEQGDLIGIGPWLLKVRKNEPETTVSRTIDDARAANRRVERLAADTVSHLAQQRLNSIVECAGAIAAVSGERELAETVLRFALVGSGFARVALLQHQAARDQVQVLAARTAAGGIGEPDAFRFSRSLLEEAASGQPARLTRSPEIQNVSHSIAELGITAAVCVPIHLGPIIAAYLYLDASDDAPTVRDDAIGFCLVIARLFGLALANLKRQELEKRHRHLERDVEAARQAQVLLVPPACGQVGVLRYASCLRPGRFVAGDLFDVTRLDDTRAAVFLGDVVGHGVGAGVLMAAAQAHLHALLERDDDPAGIVGALNRYIVDRSQTGQFVSLWLGVFDIARRSLCFVDAGHGHWLHRQPGQLLTRRVGSGGLPVGIEADQRYDAETVSFGERDRLIVFSDGLTEQRSPRGEQMGLPRLLDALRDTTCVDSDVAAALAALDAFAERTQFDDDTTIASVAWRDG